MFRLFTIKVNHVKLTIRARLYHCGLLVTPEEIFVFSLITAWLDPKDASPRFEIFELGILQEEIVHKSALFFSTIW